MINVKECPLCRSHQLSRLCTHEFRHPGDDIHDHLLDIDYVRLWILFEKILRRREPVTFYTDFCESCGLLFFNPRFTENELSLKYQAIDELGAVKYRQAEIPPVDMCGTATRIYRLVLQHWTDASATEPYLLDYGGANGQVSAPFTGRFNCGVLDFEQWDLPVGVKYLGRDLNDLYDADRFDVIILRHTLEHMNEPLKLVQGLRRHLHDDGVLYVEVPLGCFKEAFYRSEPLTHVIFFSEESLFKCLQLANLNVIHICTRYQFVSSARMWCVNAVARPREIENVVSARSVLSTKEQMAHKRYYLPYFFNRRAYAKVFKKIRGRLPRK